MERRTRARLDVGRGGQAALAHGAWALTQGAAWWSLERVLGPGETGAVLGSVWVGATVALLVWAAGRDGATWWTAGASSWVAWAGALWVLTAVIGGAAVASSPGAWRFVLAPVVSGVAAWSVLLAWRRVPRMASRRSLEADLPLNLRGPCLLARDAVDALQGGPHEDAAHALGVEVLHCAWQRHVLEQTLGPQGLGDLGDDLLATQARGTEALLSLWREEARAEDDTEARVRARAEVEAVLGRRP